MEEMRAKHVERRRNDRASGDGAIGRKTGDERWEQLLDVAAEQFAANGYRATSLQGIADRVGMLKGSLYYYINSKEDLLYEVVRTTLQGAQEYLDRATDGEEPALERLRTSIREHLVYLIENLAVTTVYLHDLKHLSAERRAQLPERTYEAVLKQLITEGQKDGSIRKDVDPLLTALAILGATNWAYRWYRPSMKVTPAQIGEEFSKILTKGLSAS